MELMAKHGHVVKELRFLCTSSFGPFLPDWWWLMFERRVCLSLPSVPNSWSWVRPCVILRMGIALLAAGHWRWQETSFRVGSDWMNNAELWQNLVERIWEQKMYTFISSSSLKGFLQLISHQNRKPWVMMAEETPESAGRQVCHKIQRCTSSTPAETFLVHGRTKFPHVNI